MTKYNDQLIIQGDTSYIFTILLDFFDNFDNFLKQVSSNRRTLYGQAYKVTLHTYLPYIFNIFCI